MKKCLKLILVIGCLAVLVGCQKSNISKEREAVLKTEANKVIDLLNQKDYAHLITLGDEQMNNPSIVASLEQLWTPAIDSQLGAFKDYGTYSIASKDGMDVVVVVSQYENTKVQFTISFNEQNQLTGLYFK